MELKVIRTSFWRKFNRLQKLMKKHTSFYIKSLKYNKFLSVSRKQPKAEGMDEKSLKTRQLKTFIFRKKISKKRDKMN